MATRVNTKVVVGIVAGVVLLCAAVVVIAFYMQQQSGSRNIARGDAAFAAGDYERAQLQYGRAVNKQPTNLEFITKWGEALVRLSPNDDNDYERLFNEYFGGVVRQVALQRPTEGSYQVDYIDQYMQRVRISNAYRNVELADNDIQMFEDRVSALASDDPDRTRVLRWRGYAIYTKAGAVAITDEEYQTAIEDLENIFELDADPESVVELYEMHYAVLQRSIADRNRAREAKARAGMERASELVDRADQDHPAIILVQFLIQGREAMGELDAQETLPQETVSGFVDGAVQRMSSIDSTKYEPFTIVSYLGRLLDFVGGERVLQLNPVVVRAIEHNPTNGMLRRLHGLMLERAGQMDDAYAAYQGLRDIPNQPISLEGFMLLSQRREALNLQTLVRIRQAELSSGDERAAKVAEARLLRDELAGIVKTSEETFVTFIDMRLALMDESYAEALRLLAQLDTQGRGATPEVLLAYVEALEGQGQPGDAKRKFEEYLSIIGRPSLRGYLVGAQIEQRLGNLELALEYYQQAAKVLQDNEQIAQRIGVLQSALGVEGAPQMAMDPVRAAIREAESLVSDNKNEEAMALLESTANEVPDDPRVVIAMASLEVVMNDRAAAATRLRSAMRVDPENADYQRLLRLVEIEDPTEASLAIIADSDEQDYVKALQREQVYRSARMDDEADAALAEADRLAPEDPAVLNRLFVRAAREGEAGFEELETILDRIAATDADGRGGALYRGRAEILKGDPEAAITIFNELTDISEFDAEAWRFKGAAQWTAGLLDDAVASYERAYQSKPRDGQYALEYAEALVAAGRGPEAARVLSPTEGVMRFGATRTLERRWLELEGVYGDRASIVEMRGKAFERNPANPENTPQLVDLLLAMENWQGAQSVIETYAALENADPLLTIRMRAGLLARQGDREAAIELLEAYIAQVPEDQRVVDPYVLLAQINVQNLDFDGALNAFERGRAYQSDRLEIDQFIANLYFTSAERIRVSASRRQPGSEDRAMLDQVWNERHEKALEFYQNLIDARGFSEMLAKRAAESALRLGRYDELDRRLAEIEREMENEGDLEVLLLRSESYGARGDAQQQREALDRAVSSNSSNPVAFYRRARVNAADSAMFPDVIADLEKAVTLRPGFVDAWTLLASVHTQMGDASIAFQKLRAAIESNPNNPELPKRLVTLLELSGRPSEALVEAGRYARENPDDEFWISRAGTLAIAVGDFDEGYRLLTELDQISPTTSLAADRLNALLRRSTGIDIPEVNRLMRRIEEFEYEEGSEAEMQYLLLRARGEAARNNPGEADKLLISAHAIAKPFGPVALRLFVASALLRFENDLQEWIDFLSNTEALRPLHPYLKLEVLQPAIFTANSDERREEVAAALDTVGGEIDPEDRVSLFRYYRLSSNLRYQMGDFERSVEASRKGLEIVPNNVEMANNLAYTLSTELGRHGEALEYALTAAQTAPNQSYVLDTLGVIQLRVGQVEEALNTLERAIATAVGPDNLLPATIHRAQALIAADREPEARQTLVRAQRAMEQSVPQVQRLYEDELQSLVQQLR